MYNFTVAITNGYYMLRLQSGPIRLYISEVQCIKGNDMHVVYI